MSTATFSLPDPPDGARRWSVITLARQLCVAPAAVHARLEPDIDPLCESPDLYSARLGHLYLDDEGEDCGDCYLTDEAAQRIAAELPIGLLARAVVADRYHAARVGLDQVHALAQHIVDTADGEQR